MKSIKVGNLHYLVTEDDLRRLFGCFGGISDIQLFSNQIINRFAVIVFSNPESADKAKVVDGLKIRGRHVTVS